jgi:hypothetical protein
MKDRLAVANGAVFLVPLPTGGFGIGVLVRADGKGRAFAAFFGPRVTDATEVDIPRLRSEDAVLLCRFGDHGLHTQRWPVIGAIPNWSADQWRLPRFCRRHDNPELRYVTEYDDSLNVLNEVVLPSADTKNLPEDAQFGPGVVEVKLAKLLD